MKTGAVIQDSARSFPHSMSTSKRCADQEQDENISTRGNACISPCRSTLTKIITVDSTYSPSSPPGHRHNLRRCNWPGRSEVLRQNVKAEYRAVVDPLPEVAIVHRRSHQGAAGEIPRGDQPAEFIHPAQHGTAEQVGVVIQVLGTIDGEISMDRPFVSRSRRGSVQPAVRPCSRCRRP